MLHPATSATHAAEIARLVAKRTFVRDIDILLGKWDYAPGRPNGAGWLFT
jgi:hypothetical protein